MTTTTLEPEIKTTAMAEFEEKITSETSSASAASMAANARPATPPATPPEFSETTSVPQESSATASAEADEPAMVRVLIVDDESVMCAMTSAIVESIGYLPITVSSGEDAIQTYQDHRDRNEAIQAVIMDLALPGGMSGLEATDALHEIDDCANVIASSGYLQQNARTAAIERGFAGILPKPYTAERLTAELRWVVTHRAR